MKTSRENSGTKHGTIGSQGKNHVPIGSQGKNLLSTNMQIRIDSERIVVNTKTSCRVESRKESFVISLFFFPGARIHLEHCR